MPHYLAYPTVKDTPSRKVRKSKRKHIFVHNGMQAAVERRARREACKEKANV